MALDGITIGGSTPAPAVKKSALAGISIGAKAPPLPAAFPAPLTQETPLIPGNAGLPDLNQKATMLPSVTPVDTSKLFSSFAARYKEPTITPRASGIDTSTAATLPKSTVVKDTFAGLPEASKQVSEKINAPINKVADLWSNTKFMQEAAEGIDQGSVIGGFGEQLAHKLAYGLSSVSAASGGLYQAPENAEQDLNDKFVKTLASGLGMMAGMSSVGNVAVGTATKVAGASAGIARLVELSRNLPLVGKYLAPFVEPLISNATGMIVHSQLDPNLADKMGARVKTLGISIATAPLYTALGAIKTAGASIPASFGLGYGMAKLSGADNQDALASGFAFALMDGAGRAGQKRGFTATEINDKMRTESLKVLNQYAGEIRLTDKYTSAQLDAIFNRAVHQSHPKTGGNTIRLEAVKSAYDFLSKGAVSERKGKPTEPEKNVEDLHTEVQKVIGEHGTEIATQALIENTGMPPERAAKVVLSAEAAHRAYAEKMGYEPYKKDSELPVLKMGPTEKSNIPTIVAGKTPATVTDVLQGKEAKLPKDLKYKLVQAPKVKALKGIKLTEAPKVLQEAPKQPITQEKVLEQVKNSQALDVQREIKKGTPRETFYKEGNTVTPQFAEGRINDIAEKLDSYKKGLGDEFKKGVDKNNVTMKGNVPEKLVERANQLVTGKNSLGLDMKQATRLTPEQAAPIAEKAAKEYWDAEIAPKVKEGKAIVINGDALKDHFGNDYNDNNHPVYSAAAFKMYERALKEDTTGAVTFTGGGPASGKSEVVVNTALNTGYKGIVYDSNLSNYEGAKKQIEMAEAAGKKVRIQGVLPNLEMARGFSVQREAKGKHGISDKTFARGHFGFPDTVMKLLENGIVGPEQVKILDMRDGADLATAVERASRGEFIQEPLAFLRKLAYNEDTLKEIYARQNFDDSGKRIQETRRGIQEPAIRKEPSPSSDGNRTDTTRDGRGDRSGIQPTEGEVKVRGLAQHVQDKAVEKRLTESFGDLPEYKTMSMKEQAKLANDILTRDPEQARRIAMGVEAPPEGVLPESMFVAVEAHAIERGDVNTLRDLATASRLVSEATTMGQRIRTLAERNPDSPVKAMADIAKAREKKVARRMPKGVTPETAKKKMVQEMQNEIKKMAPKKETWESFISSIEC